VLRWLRLAFVLAVVIVAPLPGQAQDTRIDQAWISLEDGDWDAAQALAETVLKDAQTPQDRFAAHVLLATLSFELDDLETALAAVADLDLRAQTEFGPDAPERIAALEMLGELHAEADQPDAAIAALTRAIRLGRLNGNDLDAMLFRQLRLAWVFGERGDARTAATLAAEVQITTAFTYGEAHEYALEAALLRALAHLDMGNPVEAYVQAAPALIHIDDTNAYSEPAALLQEFVVGLDRLADGDPALSDAWLTQAVARRETRFQNDQADLELTEALDRAIRGRDFDAADQIARRLTARALADDPTVVSTYTILMFAHLIADDSAAALFWATRIADFPLGYLASLDTDFTDPFGDLIFDLEQQRRFGEALRLSRLRFDLERLRAGSAAPRTLTAQLALANLALSAGRGAETDALVANALAALDDTPDQIGSVTHARFLLLRAERETDRGADDAALATLEQVLNLDGAPGQDADRIRAETLQALSLIRMRQGQNAHAAELLEQTRQLNIALSGPLSPSTHATTVMLATALFNSGEVDRALSVFDTARAVFDARGDTQNPLRAVLTLAQSRVVRETGDDAGANALFAEATNLSLATSGGAADPSTLAQFAVESRLTGRFDQARDYAARALAAAGEDHPVLPQIWDTEARLALQAGEIEAALGWLRRLTANLARPGLGARAMSRAHLPLHVSAALALAESPDDAASVALIDEAFAAAQDISTLAASQAFDAAIARMAGASDMTTRIRDLQDQQNQLATARDAYGTALAQGRADAQTLDRLRQAEQQVTTLRASIQTEFPEFAAMAYPRPVSLSDVAQLLMEDEVLLIYASSDEMLGDGTTASQLFAVTRDSVQTAPLATSSQLRSLAAELRCAAALTDAGCGGGATGTRGAFSLDAPEPATAEFDLDLAHQTYLAALAPVADLLTRNSRVIVVPDDAVIALPFNLLIRDAPGPETSLRQADWLIRHHAIRLMPTISSFVALRGRTAAPQTARAFLGVGDPLIGAQRDGPISFDCAEVAGPTALALSRSRAAGGQERGLRDLSALPDSRCELQTSAEAFQGETQLLLHLDASETALKSLSRTGRLERYSAITFATHGLVAGEVGQFDAGLVLTPPQRPDGDDDGVLTSSEVANLRLNADVVILSACNTAAGHAENDEGLSGLASAFFYAGARSVMVSHWPVYSDAASRLSAATLGRIAGADAMPVTNALRLSMLDVLDDPTATARELHPSYWGAFFIAGGS